MPDYAIACVGVSKSYRLYNSPAEQALDILGLGWIRRSGTQPKTYVALDDVTLRIVPGERVGLIGRNGAGKTTLLKLISGNFAPTVGKISVNGDVQALMSVGIGFHPDFTGYQNIESSLAYSGLEGSALQDAIADIVDFVELGDFLNQPIKTYSLGMRARLQFATATAVSPEILIIDEVLGAGDAYFAVKSAARMQRLTSSGCTVLLVSHSMQQILQYCKRTVWLDGGRILEDGEALPVVKAYERWSHERSKVITAPTPPSGGEAQAIGSASTPSASRTPLTIDHGVSRWNQGDSPLTIARVVTSDRHEMPATFFHSGEIMHVDIEITARRKGVYPLRGVVLIFGPEGQRMSRSLSGQIEIELHAKQSTWLRLTYDELLFNAGRFVFSVAIYREYNELDKAASVCYDLLSRSFEFEIAQQFDGDPGLFRHPVEWNLKADRPSSLGRKNANRDESQNTVS
jgi:lipopolysaccharide transport system ATP-binding protein